MGNEMKCSPHKVGLVVGAILGGIHVLWSILVALNWGQGLLDFILTLHMVHLAVIIGPFDFMMALELVLLTAGVGYLVGYAAAVVWNKVHKN